MIKCVIFDCDGTLVDSELLCNMALSHELSDYGVAISAEQLVAQYRGVKLDHILSDIERHYEVTLNEEFIVTYRRHVAQLFDRYLKPCDGIEQALEQLSLPICVASSGPVAKIKHALELTQLASFFGNNIFSAYEIGSWKPDPTLFLHAAQTMGFAPAQCAVVEDSVVGIQAAQAAGMSPILYDPHNIHPKLADVLTIASMSQLGLALAAHSVDLANRID
ncbi:HAD-IA family hydrolase [Neiella sp. HB171785]|uniref:HAD-IA family hydrolase n=1 Tax=Neiella litorisoli TaxID=2771431 RepID=A0A8J6QHK3_9GAMM|nr:HAD-IA family hydrolase [Neiella litorisoli]MBD1388628.1 HAD-IA family hydrolase [Neiella litorisoli]